jgi:ABC-type branched-subunit amino acid transport system permease subunit
LEVSNRGARESFASGRGTALGDLVSMKAKREHTQVILLVVLAALLCAGAIGPAYLRFLFQLALGDGLAVLGLMVLMRAGLISFGQGFYYCLGGYTAGIIGTYAGLTDAFALLLIGVAVAAVVGFIAGLLIARYREIFFAMLTLALTMILYGLLVNNEALGSTDGFNVPAPHFLRWMPTGDALGIGLFVLTCVVVGASGLMLDRYLASPMGYLGEAIRENELRVEYLGVSVLRMVLVKYVIAAALAGAGGVLTALAVGHVDPGLANWTTSGEFLFMALLGGTQNVLAPLLGAIVLQLVRSYALQYAPYLWQTILGATMLAIILFLPNGLWSLGSLGRREADA